MTDARLCPVCQGTGKIPQDTGTTASYNFKPCHGCNGLGWVAVG